MTFLSLVVFRLVHLGSRTAEARDDRGPSRSRRIADAPGFAIEPIGISYVGQRPIEPFQQYPRSK
jgi:hypothetical protein